MNFRLVSPYAPSGDQPQAIEQLVHGVKHGEAHQILLGVTGSGKTFSIASVIEKVQKPTLVITHNKTLVTQLYGEFKQFFPDNAVECFVSYYDYYQPEAYLPASRTYIEKDLNVNENLDKLRLKSISQVLSGRRDVIIVASVSAIYGAGNPREYENRIIRLEVGQPCTRKIFLDLLLNALYARTHARPMRGQFRLVGDTFDVNLPYLDYGYRIKIVDGRIARMQILDAEDGTTRDSVENAAIFPANIYLAPRHAMDDILREIGDECEAQCKYFLREGKIEEADRLQARVRSDMEMIRELGYCTGVENYSRFFDRRAMGTRPFCLIDYFADDFLCVIDESHQTIPQISGMYGGDRSRKMNLVNYGFRLPSALDNRPLNFYEFEHLVHQSIYVSATPGDYELKKTEGVIVEQIVRPTGLLDPAIEVRPSVGQIDDLLHEIHLRIEAKERVLVTTLTKKMAEKLHDFILAAGISCMYVHSDIDTLERVEILRALRLGQIDVLIGVNLLREGLDLPEVSLVAILDADKEGFLRNERSLTQTIGRAARNVNGKAILYADTITGSMRHTMDETERRRKKQIAYNRAHGIIPKTVVKSTEDILQQTSVLTIKDIEMGENTRRVRDERKTSSRKVSPWQKESAKLPNAKSADTSALSSAQTPDQLKKAIRKASKNMDFLEAARLRDILRGMEK